MYEIEMRYFYNQKISIYPKATLSYLRFHYD